MSEEHDLKLTEAVMRDPTKLDVSITIAEAWLILSAIQFATRAPLAPNLIEAMTKVGRRWQRRIGKLHPEAEQILEAGWYPSRDR